jgi:hypothetical protein
MAWLTEGKEGGKALVYWGPHHPGAWAAERIVHAGRRTRCLRGGNRHLLLLSYDLAWDFSISFYEYGAHRCEDLHVR